MRYKNKCSIFVSDITQGCLATRLSCGEIFFLVTVTNLLPNLTVKEQ